MTLMVDFIVSAIFKKNKKTAALTLKYSATMM